MIFHNFSHMRDLISLFEIFLKSYCELYFKDKRFFFLQQGGACEMGEGDANLAINNSCSASKPDKAWRFPTLDVTIPRLNNKHSQ